MKFIKKFSDLSIEDIPLVGGKNASLGEMMNALSDQGVMIPDGFAITSNAYWYIVDHNNLREKINVLLASLDDQSIKDLERVGNSLRALFYAAEIPDELQQEILAAYHGLSSEGLADVAVRSSATAEDLPGASFAGQQETFLHIQSDAALLDSCKKCWASLFTNRAIIYRIEKGFEHEAVALSIGVQKMIRSDEATAGVAFSLDTETGFKDVVMIEAAYGLGEALVKGHVVPDEYRIFKPTLIKKFNPILSKTIGSKNKKLIYDRAQTKLVAVDKRAAQKFCLTDDEIVKLARAVVAIENYYSKKNDRWMPMDVEWAKDGHDKKIYIVQARPETVHAEKTEALTVDHYALSSHQKLKVITKGQAVGKKIITGAVRIISTPEDASLLQPGEILVTAMTDPDWVPLMKKAGGIITDLGGRTCHAAIVSRELGITAIVGTAGGSQHLKNGQKITMDCAQGATGYVYDGEIPFEVTSVALGELQKPPVELLVNVGDPAQAFHANQLPYVNGVGLARLEFIIAHAIKAHPMAFVQQEKITDQAVVDKVKELSAAYPSGKEFFIETLVQGIAQIAAAFYPRFVLVRFSDFKSNEYRNLIAGSFFEPEESNPMLGLRGASRYYSDSYKDAFELEIEAIKKVRNEMGLANVAVMVPFVRTVSEADRVLSLLKEHGLERGKDGLKIFMMVEIPSNVILIDQFAERFDGFSIGSNDLTQFALAVDRDSGYLTSSFNETDEAVKEFLRLAIVGAKRNKKYIGICGQAPSDYPELAQFLIDAGISSLSLNPDSVIPFLEKSS